MHTRALTLLTSCFVVALASSPDGQTPSAPSSFGTADEAITTISGLVFRPASSSTTYSGDADTGRWVTFGPDSLWAPVTEIPNGALLMAVEFHIQDTDGAANFTGKLCRHWTESATGLNPASDCPISIASSGTGNTRLVDTPGAPGLFISYRFNVNNAGPVETVSYTLSGSWGTSTNGGIRLRQAVLFWKRQVSPPPMLATFADVPVGHPQRQFVEALAASGITGGCGAGLYCPDQPVTRGQMAVFLSAALGLHWPAF